MKKKLIYIANIRLPTEKAHGVQIMKMCEAFSLCDFEVELIVPNRLNEIKKNPFDYYDVKKIFKIRKIFCIDLISFGFGKFGFWAQNISFSLSIFFYLFLKKTEIIYSRDILSAFLISFFKKKIFIETHTLPSNLSAYKLFVRNISGIIVITEKIKDFLKEKGISENKIFVSPDGVDFEKFNINISKEEARKREDLPLDKKIILYTGHLYEWKGVFVLADASKYLGDEDLVVFVGGTEKDISYFKNRNKSLKNILILGHKSYPEMPYFLKAADVLILPNSAKEKISKFYTSPMKLFEYMASGVPIISSDLPSLREVLNEKNSLLVEPDNPETLATGIKKVLENNNFAEEISKKSLAEAKDFSWDNRVRKISSFIYSHF